LRRYVAASCILGFVAIGIIVAAAANRSAGTSATQSGQIQHDSDHAPLGRVRVLGESGTAAPSAMRVAVGAQPVSRYVVLIVLDGAQPGLFNVPKIPHVRALIRNGVDYTNAWAGILESETPSGHAAIGTGSEPRNDGILSFDWANSDNTQINLFDPSKIRDGDMERLIAQAPAPTIADMVHERYPHSRVVALGGHKYYEVDAMGGPHADAILYYTGMPDGKFSPVFVPGHCAAVRNLDP
jgi:Type I phosphodiesterase / nucleotide pyrophosphatase